MEIWVEKYRPQDLFDVVGNEPAMDRLRGLASVGSIPNLILSGPPGCGKTTSVMALARALLREEQYMKTGVLEMNASDDRGIDVVRGKIKQFAQQKVTLPENRHKIVILDEADSMTEGAQQAMRRIMEIYSSTTRFALACNQSTKIIEPIQSRCAIIRFSRLGESEILQRLKFIVEKENVPCTDGGLNALIYTAEGDMRNAINNMQSTFMGFGSVTQENVFKVCDQPQPEIVRQAIRSCIENNWENAFDRLAYLHNKGYSSGDIVGTILKIVKVFQDERIILKDEARVEFIREVADCHMRILSGCQGLVQLGGLVARLCKKASEMNLTGSIAVGGGIGLANRLERISRKFSDSISTDVTFPMSLDFLEFKLKIEVDGNEEFSFQNMEIVNFRSSSGVSLNYIVCTNLKVVILSLVFRTYSRLLMSWDDWNKSTQIFAVTKLVSLAESKFPVISDLLQFVSYERKRKILSKLFARPPASIVVKSARPYRVCDHMFRSSCPNSSVCPHVHFRPIIKPWTDLCAQEDCSFLSACKHGNSCKFLHYEEDVNFREIHYPQYQILPNQMPCQWIDRDVNFCDFSTIRNFFKFSAILADPPWDIQMSLPYQTMTDIQVKSLRLDQLQDEGFMFLWVTGRTLEIGKSCLYQWGYEEVGEIVWIKINQLNKLARTGRTGHWLNHSKEYCLVGLKGGKNNRRAKLDCDVIVAENREISRKPDEIYHVVDRLVGEESMKLEIFGRSSNLRPNWLTIGNQFSSSSRVVHMNS